MHVEVVAPERGLAVGSLPDDTVPDHVDRSCHTPDRSSTIGTIGIRYKGTNVTEQATVTSLLVSSQFTCESRIVTKA